MKIVSNTEPDSKKSQPKDVFTLLLKDETIDGAKLTQEEIDLLWEQLCASGCIICDSEIIMFGTWSPKNAVEYGGRKGKQRVFFYGLCVQHKPSPEIAEQAEQILYQAVSPFQGGRK